MQCAGTEFFLKRHLPNSSLCFTCVPGHPKREFKTKQMFLFYNFSFTRDFHRSHKTHVKKKKEIISKQQFQAVIYIGRRCDFLNNFILNTGFVLYIVAWHFFSFSEICGKYELHNMLIKDKPKRKMSYGLVRNNVK